MKSATEPAASEVDPQLAAALQRQREILKELGPAQQGVAGERLHASQARQWWNEGGPEMANVHDASLPGPRGPIAVTLYVPNANAANAALRPAYVYLHGGGYRLGSPRANDRQLREVAAAWGGIVASLDYAHLPEHAFPVAVEETAAAYRWISAHGAAWGIDGGRLAVGGSSAGANVAMGAAVQVGGVCSGYLKVCACIAGVFDDAVDTPSMLRYGNSASAPNRSTASAMFAEYANLAQRGDPRFNLLLADAGLFPPLFLAAAEVDHYRDSSLRFAEHAAKAGALPVVKIYPGMTHPFFGFSRMVDASRECAGDLARFLAQHLPA